MNNTNTNVEVGNQATRLLPIGLMWDNSEKVSGNQPKLRIILDRNLGLKITLAPGSELVAFANKKREGRADADYRIAVQLPAEIVSQEIARQTAARNEWKNTAVAATV